MAQELLKNINDPDKTAGGFRLMVAPIQGYTEAPFRHFHSVFYDQTRTLTYFTPFARVEKGEVRARDMRDINSALNENHNPVAQIICRDADEFRILVSVIRNSGHRRIDLNLGCPFPPQVRKGRGAGLLTAPEKLTEIADLMNGEFHDLRFSVKMRLGVTDSSEWKKSIDAIGSMPLTYLTVHPRTASQQYSGDLHLDCLEELKERTSHPIIYNGEITEPGNINNLRERYPWLGGVMIGRGLLSRPSLTAEWAEGREWSPVERRRKLLELHDAIFDHYSTNLSGNSQLMSKMQPFWEYFGTDFDRKAVKKLLKTTSLTNYRQAVSLLHHQ